MFIGHFAIGFASKLAPPPPSAGAMGAVGGVAAVLLVVRAWWYDRHREVRSET